MRGVGEHVLAAAETADLGEVVEAHGVTGGPLGELLQEAGTPFLELALLPVEGDRARMVGRNVHDRGCATAPAELEELTEIPGALRGQSVGVDRKSTRLNSSHGYISYAVFCLKK